VKIGLVVPEICPGTDRQTYTNIHAHHSFLLPYRRRSKNNNAKISMHLK